MQLGDIVVVKPSIEKGKVIQTNFSKLEKSHPSFLGKNRVLVSLFSGGLILTSVDKVILYSNYTILKRLQNND